LTTIDRNLLFELVSDELSFPTSVTFDDDGIPYIAESGIFNSNHKTGRILKICGTDKDNNQVLADDLRAPVNGLSYHDGFLYVSEGGYPGRISKLTLDGTLTTILDNLPSKGNYHTNMAIVGPDKKIYFSQGAMTNTGVIGLDAYEIGWLKELPHSHDIPGYDLVLNGINIETVNPLKNTNNRVKTGGFVPFGSHTSPNQVVKAQLPCTAGIMRCDLNGGNLELVAWGLRNSYGIGFLPDGRLLAIDQGADDRGSRPVGNAPDLLFEVCKDKWYGWPDFIGGDPIILSKYWPERGNPPQFLIRNHEELPPPEKPLLRFPPHSAATKFEVLSINGISCRPQIAVALFGDERPMTAPTGPRVGRSIVLVDTYDWSIKPFLTNDFMRPLDVRFNSADHSIYIVDFGKFEMQENGIVYKIQNSGKLWKVSMELLN
jgi:glucose/arabinose dehydrogenase